MTYLVAVVFFLFGSLSTLFWSRRVLNYFYDTYLTRGIYLALNLILGVVIIYFMKGL